MIYLAFLCFFNVGWQTLGQTDEDGVLCAEHVTQQTIPGPNPLRGSVGFGSIHTFDSAQKTITEMEIKDPC